MYLLYFSLNDVNFFSSMMADCQVNKIPVPFSSKTILLQMYFQSNPNVLFCFASHLFFFFFTHVEASSAIVDVSQMLTDAWHVVR